MTSDGKGKGYLTMKIGTQLLNTNYQVTELLKGLYSIRFNYIPFAESKL